MKTIQVDVVLDPDGDVVQAYDDGLAVYARPNNLEVGDDLETGFEDGCTIVRGTLTIPDA